MRYAIIILLFFAVPLRAQEIEPNLKPYYDSFLNEASSRGVKLNTCRLKMLAFPNLTKFDEILKNVKADCNSTSWCGVSITSSDNKYVYVFINASWHFAINDISREHNIYHELCHALLGIGHIEGNALMDSQHRKGFLENYQKNKKQILDEIFKR